MKIEGRIYICHLSVYSDDSYHSENEFYYLLTEHFTFSVPKRNEVLGPRNAMRGERVFREIQS